MKRQIQETSRKAFRDPENKKNRESHKDKILTLLEKFSNEGHTIRQIAMGTHLGYSPTQKRVSDLYKEGRIKICGTDIENHQEVSQYQFVSWEIQEKKVVSRHEILKQFLRQHHPKIYMQAKEKVEEQYQKLRTA